MQARVSEMQIECTRMQVSQKSQSYFSPLRNARECTNLNCIRLHSGTLSAFFCIQIHLSFSFIVDFAKKVVKCSQMHCKCSSMLSNAATKTIPQIARPPCIPLHSTASRNISISTRNTPRISPKSNNGFQTPSLLSTRHEQKKESDSHWTWLRDMLEKGVCEERSSGIDERKSGGSAERTARELCERFEIDGNGQPALVKVRKRTHVGRVERRAKHCKFARESLVSLLLLRTQIKH